MLVFTIVRLALAATPDVVAGDVPAAPAPPAAAVAEDAPAAAPAAPATDDADAASASDSDDDDGADDEAQGVDEEMEDEGRVVGDDRRYTADLSDEALRAAFERDPDSLGSISVGFAHAGRLIGGATFPRDPRWSVVEPARAFGTKETVDAIMAAVAEVSERHPGSPPLRINHLSSKDGGPQKGHRSHQSGRDVDLAFYYPHDDTARIKQREKVIDVPRTWALVRALITHGDVQTILLDRRVQGVLKKHAEKTEDKAWLSTIFEPGKDAVIKHAPHHRDHLHVRYFSPRAQELGRRVQPILALRPEHNLVAHRVKKGETLSRIARRYDTTMALIQKVNRVSPRALRIGQAIAIPLRGPCNNCPLPPPVVVPPRRLPPDMIAALTLDPLVPMMAFAQHRGDERTSGAFVEAASAAPTMATDAARVLDEELAAVVDAVIRPRAVAAPGGRATCEGSPLGIGARHTPPVR